MAETSVARKLRELEERYAHELQSEEGRLEIRERILKLRKKAETVEAGRT